MMTLMLALLIGFGGLIVLFAPFWVSAELSEEERRFMEAGNPVPSMAGNFNGERVGSAERW